MNKKMDEVGRKRLPTVIILALSILLIFTLISASLRGPHPLQPVEGFVVRVTAPIFNFFHGAVALASRIWRGYIYLVGVQAENERLKMLAQESLSKEALYQETLLEKERLRQLLEFKNQAALPVTGARIIGFDFSIWFKCAFLDKGANDGIRWSMPVINAAGVVGRIVEVYPEYAKVLLLIDRTSAVDAIVQRNRLRGILNGVGANRCFLRYIHKSQDVQVGDIILASGLGGIFPRGMVLGTVTAVDKKVPGLFQEVEVEPAADYTRLEEVLVVKTVQTVLSKP
ncbi:MAG: rod shape-determining protein MreC [Desulfobacca sp.]|uniref:rod shape-determining protein MreC n=1 Tax=Desulfobacca sp. TaxID=2067990 RepID=UPI0040495F6E